MARRSPGQSHPDRRCPDRRRPGTRTAVQLLIITTALLAALPTAAQSTYNGPYLNAGWHSSITGESQYIPGRPELTLGWFRDEGIGLEAGMAWTYLSDDGYRVFFLDEQNTATIDAVDITDRDAIGTRYHVADIGLRLTYPLLSPVVLATGGVETTQVLFSYRNRDGVRQDWQLMDDTPWVVTYGVRIQMRWVFLEWRGSWNLSFDDWSGWDDVHRHGITAGFTVNPWSRDDLGF